MTGQVPVTEEHLDVLREDLQYSLKQLSSIVKDDDYANLGNHAIEAIGEMDLFSLAEVCLSLPFFMFHPIVVSF